MNSKNKQIALGVFSIIPVVALCVYIKTSFTVIGQDLPCATSCICETSSTEEYTPVTTTTKTTEETTTTTIFTSTTKGTTTTKTTLATETNTFKETYTVSLKETEVVNLSANYSYEQDFSFDELIHIETQEEPLYTTCTEIEELTEEDFYSTEIKTTETQSCSGISEYDRVLLCNLVGREYGSDSVSVYEKAKVVACVMNRVKSTDFPDNIYDVLTQPNQFTGYLPCDYYTDKVTDSVIEAVDYYFSHPDEFGEYLYFYGDGNMNHFYN